MDTSVPALLALYDEMAPLAEASTIPAPWYLDTRIEALERNHVFGSNWIVAGRADQVASPGDYFTLDLVGEPLLVVRGADSQLRAFYNVCRHHAAAVATCPQGRAQFFRCPYHGWNYGLDGSLKGMPEFAGVCNFDRNSNGLAPIAVDLWEHFVFVNLASNPQPLWQLLGDIIPRIDPLQLSNLHYHSTKSYTLNCNWKVYVDNYLDGGYHVPHLHKGLNSVLDYTHYTIENGERFCLQSSPMVTGDDAQVAATRIGDRAWYFWLYPNFMINVYEGVMDTNLVLPLGPNRCRVLFDFYFSDVSPEREGHNLASIATSDTVQDEDVAICESVQRGLASRAYGAGRLSVRREAGEHLFHRLLARDLKSAASALTPLSMRS
ncbi:aromatic ring-hydroxylating dioxygenase subunit alpha [Acidicapsa dinghuensis]|uniref:Aromatic ring-hydroxylating dioxygenase subunit alpha n=1 Tax=Acidicapsa dinghuensis TaxID=2218256 RepID=A0ABW1EK42_9BACT|nr:aromatic ring-hydroxylating dioxygenase subunit alpha [Acidicapsa dinghuensis]